MKNRIITGFGLALTLIPTFYVGGILLDIVLVLFTMIATYELTKLLQKEETFSAVTFVTMILSGGLFYVMSYYYRNQLDPDYVVAGMLLVIIIGASFTIFKESYDSGRFGNMLISILYPVLGFSALSAMRNGVDGTLYTVGFLFMITIFTDMFAYIVGVNFGKHRLAVKISPKKSIEGSIGGTVFAVLFTLLYLTIFKVEVIFGMEVQIGWMIVLIFILSIVGQIGDLIASRFKRDYDVKDYGKLFPGHGGVMDRFDSALFVAMVLLFISKVVGFL